MTLSRSYAHATVAPVVSSPLGRTTGNEIPKHATHARAGSHTSSQGSLTLRSIPTFGALLGIVISLAGCSSSGGGQGAGSSSCVPNATSACVGPNGCSGQQTCSAQGNGYSVCSCASGGGAPGGAGGQPGGGLGGQPGGGSGGLGGQPGGGSGGLGGQPAGGSGGTGAGPAACDIAPTGASCNSCFQTKCVGQCGSCSSNPSCMSLLECVDNCSTSSCVSGCIAAYPSGKVDFESVVACAYGESLCGPVCDTGSPIAAPCNHDYQCAVGFCANSDGKTSFCSNYCTNSDACGDYAWCMPNAANQNICFPACTYTSDCAYLGSSFKCNTWKNKEGYTVSACST